MFCTINNQGSGITTVKMMKNWTGKKSPTDPKQKEKHQVRKYKKQYLHELGVKEQQKQIEDFIDGYKPRD